MWLDYWSLDLWLKGPGPSGPIIRFSWSFNFQWQIPRTVHNCTSSSKKPWNWNSVSYEIIQMWGIKLCCSSFSASLLISNPCPNCSIYSNRWMSWSLVLTFLGVCCLPVPDTEHDQSSAIVDHVVGIQTPVQQWNPILTPKERFRSKP